MSPAKPRAGKVNIERDAAVVAAARALAGRGLIEVSWPPLLAHVHSAATGTDACEHAGEGIGALGSPTGNGWVIQAAREHDAQLVVLAPYLVQSVTETSGQTVAEFAKSLEPLADAGLDVIVRNETVPRAKPAPEPEPVRMGEPVVGPFAVGEVHEAIGSVTDVLAELGRGATTVLYCPPDRLLARRAGSSLRSVHRLHSVGQTAEEWLDGVLLSHEPRLLLVERAALERMPDLDLKTLAVDRRIAIGMTP